MSSWSIATTVATRCTVERLKREHDWRGVTRARRPPRTTVADPAAQRAPDLIKRNFKASRPGELHVADFTYVPMDTGRFGYTAFAIDAFAGLIPGWECSLSKKTAFAEAAIRQAAAYWATARPACPACPAPGPSGPLVPCPSGLPGSRPGPDGPARPRGR